MKNEFEITLQEIYNEIKNLKEARLKSAGVIATTDSPLSATFTVTELEYGLFSSRAIYITAESINGDSFLSELLFTGEWDGRGYEARKVYEDKGKTTWCVALTVPTTADYEYYYDQGHGPFDISINILVRTTSEFNVTTSWGDNPYASVW